MILILVRHACFRDEVYDFVGIKWQLRAGVS